ncbi:MAG TPA: metalloregulator ArsR/SmtB family transcription factor [Thermoanaerobaculia bacterium]|nr:metalloregulator ArsR/SmtB family transcription factor [Thermoanaerobaculia bacterium]
MKNKPGSFADDLEELFQALSDATRLRLINLMAHNELCVCFFVEVLGQPQPTISRHLAYLRKAGLVADRRDGKWIHYRLSPPAASGVREVFDALLSSMQSDATMQDDVRKLYTACCSPRMPAILRRAPKPAAAPANVSGD